MVVYDKTGTDLILTTKATGRCDICIHLEEEKNDNFRNFKFNINGETITGVDNEYNLTLKNNYDELDVKESSDLNYFGIYDNCTKLNIH